MFETLQLKHFQLQLFENKVIDMYDKNDRTNPDHLPLINIRLTYCQVFGTY
jgi:hypothetical protein